MARDILFLGTAVFGGLTAAGAQDMTPQRPNILFCIADDAAWLHFGAYGCGWVSTCLLYTSDAADE